MSNTVLRREGDTVHLEHKYYGKFKFREAAPLADAAAASAMVFAGERTDGGSPTRVAIKFDNGNQVYSDHMHWSQLYYNPATRFAGLPWILSQTIPEAPWGDKKVDVMVSELLGDSLEAVRLRNPERTLPPSAVCCVAVQTLDMLAAMHAAGIVHRDIKPANLLLPLARTGPQQLHIIDFGIAGKIDARGAAQGQNPDGTPLYAHRGAALRAPVSFRDDLEALGYTLLSLAAGALPWEELALAQLPKRAQEQRSRDVAALKRTSLAAALAAVRPPPLSAALRTYFGALRLEQGADNAARFDYGALRAPFCDAYVQLAGAPYAPATLDLDASVPAPAAGAAAAGRKRRAPKAAADDANKPPGEAEPAPQQPKRKSTRRGFGAPGTLTAPPHDVQISAPAGAQVMFAPSVQEMRMGGAAALSSVPGVVIRQTAQLLNVATAVTGAPFEAAYEFKVYAMPPERRAARTPTEAGAWEPSPEEIASLPLLFTIQEESDCFVRVLLSLLGGLNLRCLTLHYLLGPAGAAACGGSSAPGATMLPGVGAEVLTATRPCRLGLGCCSPLLMRLRDGGGMPLGEVGEACDAGVCLQQCCCCVFSHQVRSTPPGAAAPQHRYTLQAPLCCVGGRVNNCCGATCCRPHLVMDVATPDGKLASTVQKTYGKGRGCQACMRCAFEFDTYVLEFPPDATAQERALLLAAVLSIDYALFSRRGGENT